MSGYLVFGLWLALIAAALRCGGMIYELFYKDETPSGRIASFVLFFVNIITGWAVWQVIP